MTGLKILMPLIREMMPNIIAHDIIGVQPLTMPKGIIFDSIRKTVVMPRNMTNAQYQHFLRLNNRRRRQSVYDLLQAGYPDAEADYGGEIVAWCRENLPDRHMRFGNRYFFANDEDRLIFVLRWS